MRRMHEEYGDERFERLAGISNGQFYNLRKSTTYRRRRTTFRETRTTGVSIGERRKPRPKGSAGLPERRHGASGGPERREGRIPRTSWTR